MLALLAALACAPPPPPAPAWTPDLAAFTGAEATCLAAACAKSDSQATFDSCRASSCAERKPVWKVHPTRIRHEDGIVTLEAQVEHTPGAFGSVVDTAVSDAWLGATVLTKTGEEIDLAVQTVFANNIGQPFALSSEVGADVQDVILGLWGKKIEPCDVARMGCRNFGFVLDQSLAAWPPATYTENPARRQRILPPKLTFAILGPNADSMTTKLAPVTTEAQSVFGTTFEPKAVTAGASQAGPAVLYGNAHDGPLASEFAAVLGDGVAVREDASAPADITVVLGGASAP